MLTFPKQLFPASGDDHAFRARLDNSNPWCWRLHQPSPRANKAPISGRQPQ